MMTLVFNPFKYIAKNLEFESVINSKRWELLLWEDYILKEYSVRHLDGRFLILWTSSCWAKRDMSTGFPKYLLSIVKWPSRLQAAMTTAAARSTCHISIDSFSKGTTSQNVFRQFTSMPELNVNISFRCPQVSWVVQISAQVKTVHTGVWLQLRNPELRKC